ncbi:MAG TPA: electron transport complex subunit RsxC [Firmicutes bacterium]|nr:electron transport complex subunit RsxC [Bacillota bacterium]
MRLKTFRGGAHVPHFKELTATKPIRDARLPAKVVVALHQHTGAPCEALVKVGDHVKVGQKIGDSKAALTAPVHAPVSGKVVDIAPYPQSGGREVVSIVIESDGLQEVADTVRPKGELDGLSQGDLREIIREAGIVGLGGAAFPTYFKLTPPPGKSFDTLIINGSECEPYLTADQRLMMERPEDAIFGTRVLMKAAGVSRAFIGIEENKPEAIEAMQKAAERHSGIEIVPLAAKYPQGAEKQLIKAIVNREVPCGGLPVDVGVIVNNVGTAVAVGEAISTGMPLVERVVTVTGSPVKEPSNLKVKIGTLVSDLVEECEGFASEPAKVIIGGPMMGVAQFTMDIPVTKGTSGVLFLTIDEVSLEEPLPCVRCGKCVENCPMHLLPLFISQYADAGRFDEAAEYGAMDCIECGSCSFICPSRRHLVQSIRLAKAEIAARRRKK